MNRTLRLLAAALLLWVGSGLGSSATEPAAKRAGKASTTSGDVVPPGMMNPLPLPVSDRLKNITVILRTDRGLIVVSLLPSISPVACASFLNLAQNGKYDNTLFHRVAPGIMVQGGNISVAQSYRFETEPAPRGAFSRPGMLALVNSGPLTNGAQFFITLAPAPGAEGKYSILGYVTAGMETLSSIQKGDHLKGIDIVDPTEPLLTQMKARIDRWNAEP